MTSWLPAQFEPPQLVPLPTGDHLRPITAADVALDYPAVMGSRLRLWDKYGAAWGWPPASMTVEQDREDLARHAREAQAHESFNYAVLNADESRLLGCVYIDPPGEEAPQGVGAVTSWWVVDDHVGSDLDTALSGFVPQWLSQVWGFEQVHHAP